MGKHLNFLLLVLACGLLLSCGKKAEPKSPPVNFAVETDSAIINGVDLRGEVVYLDFWASWCVPCRASFPWMNEMQAKYSADGLKVIGVSLDQERALAKRFANEFEAEFQIGFDSSGELSNQFKVVQLPHSFIIGRNGAVVSSHKGFNKELAVDFEAAILEALKIN